MQPNGGPLVSGPGGSWNLAYPATTDYPTDPGALKSVIAQTFQVTGDATTYFLIAGTLLQTGASPPLRAALFELIKGLPGVQLQSSATDPAGRQGVGLFIDGFGNQYELIFDTATSAVLGEETRALATTNTEGEQNYSRYGHRFGSLWSDRCRRFDK